MIAIDIETYDPNLADLGPGCMRKDGFVGMIGLYDGRDYVACLADDPRLADWLASDEDKVFHNGVYDLAWLVAGYDFKVGGTWHDTMTRASLINEYTDLDLDSCCKRMGVKGKNKDVTIDTWFESVRRQHNLKGSIWDNPDFWVMPDSPGWTHVEEYNKQDCKATYDLFYAQESHMTLLKEPYQLECELFPLWIDMKKQGIRVDTSRMDQLKYEIDKLKVAQEKQLWNEYQFSPDIIASPKKMTLNMHRLGIHSPSKTETGAESWSATALPLIDHPIIPMIFNYKNLDYISGKKGVEKIRACLVGDRIHCDFSPNKRAVDAWGGGGTITGRLSSAHPNLQNIPSREEAYQEKAWGPEMRSLFIPEEGCMIAAPDYGQIETRVMAHNAVGPHAEWFRDQCKNLNVDMHKLAMERTGIKSRYIIKRIDFGVPYGMGINKMISVDYPAFKKAATEHGVDDVYEYGRALYQQFKTGFPVLFDMMSHIENVVRNTGYITGIGGRIHHKPPPELNNRGAYAVPYYKMTCYQIQGSAAEILKNGLRNAYKEGLFNTLPMHLTVHDENVVSVPFNKEGTEALQRLVIVMEESYKDRLTVPLTTACEVGPHWGYWSKDIWKEMQKGEFKEDAWTRVYAPEVHKNLWCVKNGYKGLDGILNIVDEEKFSA